jgi:hypothetical protein
MVTIDIPQSRKTVHGATVVIAVVCLAFLSACGRADGDSARSSTEISGHATSSVASIKAPATESARPTQAERPLIRLDASDADMVRIAEPYIDCMVQHGLPKQMVMKGPQGGYPGDLESLGLGRGVAAKIKAACGSLEPELEFQRAKRLDPDFADHARADAKCLTDHGIKASVQKDGDVAGDGLPSGSQAHWLDDCERKAFASYYSTLH